MNLDAVIKLFLGVIPMFSTIACGLMLFVRYGSSASKNERHLKRLLLCYLTTIALMASLITSYYFFENPYILISILILTGLLILIVLNVIKLNKLYFETKTEKDEILSIINEDEQILYHGEDKDTTTLPLTKERFEKYMQDNKPYLNPDLKITDLAICLNTNRTYLSTFINRTYGMGFRRYLNLCRLKEAQKIREQSTGNDITEIILKAGFGCYRSYIRFRNQEEKHTLSNNQI